jgi:CDP-glucose 4,6-dehydratase
MGWSPRWDLGTALARVIDWHRAWRAKADVRAACLGQIEGYLKG